MPRMSHAFNTFVEQTWDDKAGCSNTHVSYARTCIRMRVNVQLNNISTQKRASNLRHSTVTHVSTNK